MVTEDSKVQLNKNTVNDTRPILPLIGGLPSGMPVAFRGRVRLGLAGPAAGGLRLRGAHVHPLRCKAIASARLENDKERRGHLGAAATGGPAPGGVDRAAGQRPEAERRESEGLPASIRGDCPIRAAPP